MMTPNEYQQLALRTENTPDFMGGGEKKSLERSLHGAIGLCTEVGELSEVIGAAFDGGSFEEVDGINLVEEVGDVLWYLAILLDAHGIEMNDYTADLLAKPEGVDPSDVCVDGSEAIEDGDDAVIAILRMTACAGQIQDVLKRHLMYRKDLDREKLLVEIQAFVEALTFFSWSVNTSFPVAAERNIAKLSARYPDKYTDEAAINRNIEAERKALES
jgi:NTP pyrophosphatase (non-canonical NTP hydrolase)